MPHYRYQIGFIKEALMQIRITSKSDGVPIYVQIVNQVKHLGGIGAIDAGRGKTRRSGRWRISSWSIPTRWARAYLELSALGVVTKRHGSGAVMFLWTHRRSRREKLKVLTQRVDALLVEAGHLDVDLSEAGRAAAPARRSDPGIRRQREFERLMNMKFPSPSSAGNRGGHN